MGLIATEGCLNFRDMGGLAGRDGKLTREKQVFRADCLSKLTDEDIEMLQEMGVRFVIDLRSEYEVRTGEYPLLGHGRIGYESVPLSDELNPQNLAAAMPDGMTALYVDIVNRFGAQLARVFTLLAQHAPGVVFHCTAGKDRTGVVAALLLELHGVSEEDIIADYAESFTNMKPFFDAFLLPMRKLRKDVPDYVFRSDPEYMRDFLAYFHREYGTAETYLRSQGVSQEALDKLGKLLF